MSLPQRENNHISKNELRSELRILEIKIESKIQDEVHKIKSMIMEDRYKRLKCIAITVLIFGMSFLTGIMAIGFHWI